MWLTKGLGSPTNKSKECKLEPRPESTILSHIHVTFDLFTAKTVACYKMRVGGSDLSLHIRDKPQIFAYLLTL